MLALPRRLALLVVASTVLLGACGGDTPADRAADATTTIPVVSEVGQRRPWDGMILPPDVGDGYGSPATAAELAELAELGAPNVAVVVPLVQDGPGGLPHGTAPRTPSDEALAELVVAAAELDLGVVLQLRVEVAGDPVAAPRPDDRDHWFQRYRSLAVHYARLAERHGASMLVLGGGVGALTAHGQAWGQVIDEVRDVYDGPVAFTVEADQLEQVSFWEAVDVIGVDITFPPESDEPEPVAADLEKAWEPVLAHLTELAAAWSRPVVFTRVGFPGVERTTADPPELAADRQRSAYEALFTVINQTPAVEGVLVWRWGTDPTTVGEVEATYSPEDRPAEEVLRRAWTTPLADQGDDDQGDGDGAGGT